MAIEKELQIHERNVLHSKANAWRIMSTIHSAHLVHCSHRQRDEKRQQNKKNKVTHTLTRIHTEPKSWKTIFVHLVYETSCTYTDHLSKSTQSSTHTICIFSSLHLHLRLARARVCVCVCVCAIFFFNCATVSNSFFHFSRVKLKSHFIFWVWCVHYSCREQTKKANFWIFRIIFKKWKFYRFFFRLFESFVLFVFIFWFKKQNSFQVCFASPPCDLFVQH